MASMTFSLSDLAGAAAPDVRPDVVQGDFELVDGRMLWDFSSYLIFY
jgi:hypothetical protein